MSARERPILFSGPMVLAILDGTKTQTRRVVKPIKGVTPERIGAAGPEVIERLSPYGQPGDRLWVREAHALVPATAYAMSTDDGVTRIPQRRSPEDSDTAVVYREGWSRCKPGRWRPSIHMPRWASRITLEVTDVRVERVQEITEDEARAEGVQGDEHPWADQPTAVMCFDALWDEINAARGYGWDENPWVWVVSFKRLEALDA